MGNDNEELNTLAEVIVTYDFTRLSEIKFSFSNTKQLSVCQNIFAFDTESSSGYLDNSNISHHIHGFSHGNANRYLNDIIHRFVAYSLPWAWMTAIVDSDWTKIYVFIGREKDDYYEFEQMLERILRKRSNATKNRKVKHITYVHNLSYDFSAFLRNVYNDTDFKVFARSERKPIKADYYSASGAYINTYKCSLFLVQKSLANWCEDEKLPVCKVKVKEDFYLKIRTPKTPLTKEDEEYIVGDVVSMCYGIQKYIDKYQRIDLIPMTATGEVRLRFKRLARTSPDYSFNNYSMAQSYDHDFLCKLMKTFQGGYSHANAYYKGKLLRPVKNINPAKSRILTGYDFASSYPAVMCSFGGFPISVFTQEDVSRFDLYKDDDPNHPKKCFMMKISFKNVKSKLDNSFWSFSKLENDTKTIEDIKVLSKSDDKTGLVAKMATRDANGNYGCVLDNGRIHSIHEMTAYMTNVDWDIFKRVYEFDSYEVEELYTADAGYLDKGLIELILEAYEDKTKLKTVGGSKYDASKRLINSAYGVFVTKILTSVVSFGEYKKIDDNGEVVTDEDGNEVICSGWNERPANESDYDKILEKMNPQETITYYAAGVWVTAAARWRLWSGAIIPCDHQIVYCDTDSAKIFGSIKDVQQIEKFNKWIINEERACAKHYGIDFKKYAPTTPEGEPKQLGVFALDVKKKSDVLDDGYSIYKEFKTLGAKRYAYLDKKGVHTTIAGLPKDAGTKVIKKVDDLENNCFWNTKQSHKKMHYYNDVQMECVWVDYLGNEYKSDYRYGVAITPTTFDLSVTAEFKAFCMWLAGYNDKNYVNDNYEALSN